MGVTAYLVDGTYELFRHFYGLPEGVRSQPGTNSAVRGVLWTVYYLLEEGATHVGVATDHVIESFRNDLWRGYKTGDGVDPVLKAQFPVLEEGLEAMGVTVWPMVELEADDALATAAAVLDRDTEGVDRVVIMTVDKDLAQCVRDQRVVQFDRRAKKMFDVAGVTEKFGVPPASIPDYLALVGDSADGFPGLAGFGAKSAAAVLRVYGHIEKIPADGRAWEVPGLRTPQKLADTLAGNIELAMLFKTLATLQIDDDLVKGVGDLHWRGPTDGFEAFVERIDGGELAKRAAALAAARS
ncbi:MAG TPA: 5'-3' exonuclease H3TH domain-containing protein [Acidimicrobiales bacterium]|jgi:5'-3' exonuclease|nr:5'-3' exonuclease H3TH domain-containing protein [Acidimicrobiales bacterium]